MSDNAPFNIREVNVLNIKNSADAEIAIDECSFALEQIAQQKKVPRFARDADWLVDAARASTHIEHKRALLQKKLAHLLAQEEQRAGAAAKPPEQVFATRFVKAAKKMLPPEKYDEIHQAAIEAGLALKAAA